MTDTHRFSVSVAGAIIRQDGKVLAIKRRDNGHWEPPGGVLEPGEDMLAGLQREVLEETGLSVEADRLSGVYQNMERDIISLVFRCRTIQGELRRSDETSDLRWLTVEECNTLMDAAYAVRLTDALSETTPMTRTHDGVTLTRP